MTFTTRAGKGTALTHQELDDNFATLGAVHGADQVVLTVPTTVNETLTVDATGKGAGFIAIGDTFASVARVQKDFPIGDTFETGFINQANYADTMPNMISAPGFFGHTMQFRFTCASHPLIVDGNSKPDTFLGGFNTYVQSSRYTDDDNFFATFSISSLDRVNQSESFPESARFSKDGFEAPLGITSKGNNNIGDGTGGITINGDLFILGGNPVAPTATTDPGTPGELRVTSPNGINFYMYLYADGVGWLRSEFTTF